MYMYIIHVCTLYMCIVTFIVRNLRKRVCMRVCLCVLRGVGVKGRGEGGGGGGG